MPEKSDSLPKAERIPSAANSFASSKACVALNRGKSTDSSAGRAWLRQAIHSVDCQANALAVTVELRRVHALNLRDAGLVFTAQLDAG